MHSDEPRFKHIGLSSDGAVIFCEMDNGKTYAMPLIALERAEDWNAKAKPNSAKIIQDGYAAFVEFDTGLKIDFPSDFVLHICEPSYAYYKGKSRARTGVGARIREIRRARGMTLDQLATKSGIAKPNLSRLEHDKVTPTFPTINAIATALDTHPALLSSKHAWTYTQQKFIEWKLALIWSEGAGNCEHVRAVDLVKVFLATRPEHRYARLKLLTYADPNGTGLGGYSLNAQTWSREMAAAKAAQQSSKAPYRKEPAGAKE